MRTRIGALVLAVVAGLAGCGSTPPPEACGEEKLTDGEGRVYRCVASEDCPRSSGMTLCVSDVDVSEACIRCLDTECVRVFPEAC